MLPAGLGGGLLPWRRSRRSAGTTRARGARACCFRRAVCGGGPADPPARQDRPAPRAEGALALLALAAYVRMSAYARHNSVQGATSVHSSCQRNLVSKIWNGTQKYFLLLRIGEPKPNRGIDRQAGLRGQITFSFLGLPTRRPEIQRQTSPVWIQGINNGRPFAIDFVLNTCSKQS